MGPPFKFAFFPLMLEAEAAGDVAGGAPNAFGAGATAKTKAAAAPAARANQTFRNPQPKVVGFSRRANARNLNDIFIVCL
jgi:hypothetical protein